ncbi:hypothetical protein DMENIID0001_115510 [Sergentomyia squamirostris]
MKLVLTIQVLGILLFNTEAKEGFRTVKAGSKTFYVSNDKRDWFRAQAECQIRNLVIATIKSKDETDALYRTACSSRDYMWIGGYKYYGNWHWISTGELLKYTNWDKGEPNNKGGKENALEVRCKTRGGWNDKDPSAKRFYVCQNKDVDKRQSEPLESAPEIL